jgi:hypothetical protein
VFPLGASSLVAISCLREQRAPPSLASATLRRTDQHHHLRHQRRLHSSFATHHMAIEKGVTEVADSEDDPMTSSPGVVSDEAADKLRAMSCGPYQERQDALHDADGLHQASAERDANASEILGGDPIDASTDGYASKIDQTNMTLHETSAAQKGEGASLEGGSDDRGLHPQVHTRQPESTSRDISNVPHVTVVSAKHLEAVVVQEVESDLPGGEEQRSTSSHTVQGSAEKKISEAAQPTVMDAPSKAPGAPVHVPSDSSSNSEIPNESTYQSQDNATRDTLSQESNEYLGSAAAHYLVDGHTRENVVCPRLVLLDFIRSHAIGPLSTSLNSCQYRVRDDKECDRLVRRRRCRSSKIITSSSHDHAGRLHQLYSSWGPSARRYAFQLAYGYRH